MSDNEDNVSNASFDDNESINEEEEDSVLESINIEDDIDEDELEYEDVDLEALEEQVQTKKNKTQKVNSKTIDEDIDNLSIDSDSTDISDDEDDEEDDDYVKRFEKIDQQMKEDHITKYHHITLQENYQEIATLSLVVRNDKGEIIDPLHKTIPIMTKYEKARILGQRAKQINSGANIFIQPKQETFDGYLIALQELEEKKLPFIIRRPLPNGHSEYWKVSDLEYLHEIAY